MIRFASFIVIMIVLSSCTDNKTYLVNDEKGWNPYVKGQKIVFESREGTLDSIRISDVLHQFPDGLGVVDKYEILNVVGDYKNLDHIGNIKTDIFSIHAKTSQRGSRIRFGLSLGGSKFYSDYFDFIYIKNISEINVSVPYGSYNDVVVIRNDKDYSNIPNAIKLLYWSKSKGYVRYDKYDGTIWELKDVSN